MKEPLVSVVVPSYNHAAFLEEALASALESTLPIELVVVDDGSSDESVVLLESWARKEKRLRFYGQENAGAHAALNRAISLARAEVVMVLNSDDVFLPGRIERLYQAFAEDQNLILAGSWLEVIDHQGKTLAIKEGWRTLPPPWQKAESLGGLVDPALRLLESNYFSTTSNAAFRRSKLRREPFRALRYAHDWDFLLELATRGSILLLEEPLLKYRVHPSNTIKEGQDAGRGLMHFEILWLLAAHAARLVRQREEHFADSDLELLAAESMPDFGRRDLLFTLLALRGSSAEPSPFYLALLKEDNPLRRQWIEDLAAVTP